MFSLVNEFKFWSIWLLSLFCDSEIDSHLGSTPLFGNIDPMSLEISIGVGCMTIRSLFSYD